MSETTETKGWKHNLFKKNYPAWLYTVVVAIAALLVYFWFRSTAGM